MAFSVQSFMDSVLISVVGIEPHTPLSVIQERQCILSYVIFIENNYVFVYFYDGLTVWQDIFYFPHFLLWILLFAELIFSCKIDETDETEEALVSYRSIIDSGLVSGILGLSINGATLLCTEILYK